MVRKIKHHCIAFLYATSLSVETYASLYSSFHRMLCFGLKTAFDSPHNHATFEPSVFLEKSNLHCFGKQIKYIIINVSGLVASSINSQLF